METRLASLGDTAALTAMHELCFGAAKWSFQQIRGSLDLPTTRAMIAQKKAVPQGFIIYQITHGEAEIQTFCVVPSARRKGVGQKLLQAALADLARRSVGRFFLEVAADNEAALAFYRKNHFKPNGQRAGYYRRDAQTVEAIMLSLNLLETEPL